jgi:lipoprotein-anchoring transpeptidase ErfK/SrfK
MLAGVLAAVLTVGAGPALAATAGRVSTIDATTYRMTVTNHSRTVMPLTAGFGKPGFRTPSGTFHVLGKDAVITMTSCSAQITCNPNYYMLTVHWAVRLTSSGVFVHAAPWDHAIGRTDTSHGFSHLSTQDAHRFDDFSRIGDTVIVKTAEPSPVGGAVRNAPTPHR